METSPDKPLEDTVKLSQKGLNIFAGTAKVTEGQVSLEKTKWYLMEFKWYPEGKWRLTDKEATLTPPSQKGGSEI